MTNKQFQSLMTQMKTMTQQPVANKNKKKKQNNQVAVRKTKTPQTNVNNAPVPIFTSGAAVSDMLRRETKMFSKQRLTRTMQKIKLTRDGELFLKAVYAPPDFAGQGAFCGIPDELAMPSLKYRHAFVGDFWSSVVASVARFGGVSPITAGCDVIVVQPPVPGVAFYVAFVTPGAMVNDSTLFYPVTYSDYADLFGAEINIPPIAPVPSVNGLITKFRMAGSSLELICTTNAFNWSGSITGTKGTSEMAPSDIYSGASGNMSHTFNGMQNANARGNTSTYVAGANLGIFQTAVNDEKEFPWTSVNTNYFNMNQGSDPNSAGILLGQFPGLGTLETNYVRLSGIWGSATTTPITTFQVRCWSTVEYVPKTGSSLNNFITPNALLDPAALLAYRAVADELPVAVQYSENSSFWKKLLGVIGSIGTSMSVIPGWGAIAGGIGTAANAASNLL